MFTPFKTTDFSAMRLRLASPDVIKEWSFGEVLKPETINYRTQRPEKDGLFCEKIFGPSKDWECYCGKYKKIRYKGIVCDKCGVEVTRSVVRRERMGHIALSVPVTHIWYLRNVPSRIGLLLDLSVQNLEKVIYFASFMITRVDEDFKTKIVEQIKNEHRGKKKSIIAEYDQRLKRVQEQEEKGDVTDKESEKFKKEAALIRDNKTTELEEAFFQAEEELKIIKKFNILSEASYYDLSLKFGHIFEAGIGAEAIRRTLEEINLEKTINDLETLLKKSKGAKKEKLMRRIRLLNHLYKNNIRPEWMILNTVPVIPPDLRPMVALDGGRFATSDLNDLYRRVINRNNRLKQLLELKAPEVIVRNEKRMLQEAVDALIDNGARHSKTVTASTGQKRMLKSLADMLKGKQGRFRQNLLGKRTDYSGRSVIVVGPHLKIFQCGLPKKMALELFKPFIISRLIKEGYVHNVRSGSRYIESNKPEVWDILEGIIKDAHVFLNRAPTLHRLGIQAFKPILIEGKAIQVHPLVCAAFNADFDGDQMAVHVPLTEEAKGEAANLMLSSKNLLSPARGEPISTPSKDIVWGSYFMTSIPKKFSDLDAIPMSYDEALIQYNLGILPLQKKISVKSGIRGKTEEGFVETTIGRLLFNEIVPEKLTFVNEVMDAKSVRKLVGLSFEKYGLDETGLFLDRIKEIGYEYATISGWSWGMDDVPPLAEKPKILAAADKLVDECQQQYEMGLLTKQERYTKVIEIWTEAKEKIVGISTNAMDPDGPVSTMVNSGARGSASQLIQIVGMKGLVANPAGDIIELPVKGNFKDGMDVLEYFNSTHGARKGLADTALRTASSGYLTRRMVDVAQEVVITTEDCGTEKYKFVHRKQSEEMGKTLAERIIGRFVAVDIIHPKTNKVILGKGGIIDDKTATAIDKAGLNEVPVRSVLSCVAEKGICQQCYGWDLGSNSIVKLGTAVGVIAAQSIGEPGTQLTMRTFHTGGVAGSDITQGLPRVEEIFEVRPPKHRAVISDVEGKVDIDEVSIESGVDTTSGKVERGLIQKVIKIKYLDTEEDKYIFESKSKKKKNKSVVKVKEGDNLPPGSLLFIDADGNEVATERGGLVKLEKNHIIISTKVNKVKEYPVPVGYKIWVKKGDTIEKGTPLTEGSYDLVQYFKLRNLDDVHKYVVKEIQHIYSSQGQRLNDKHIEIIIKQMFSRVYVKESGSTTFLPGDVIAARAFRKANEIASKKGKPAIGEQLIMGISKVALSTDSFLSAASFQETAKVLIEASLTGKIDKLEGLKENVIIGRLIPVGAGFKQKKK